MTAEREECASRGTSYLALLEGALRHSIAAFPLNLGRRHSYVSHSTDISNLRLDVRACVTVAGDTQNTCPIAPSHTSGWTVVSTKEVFRSARRPRKPLSEVYGE